MMIMLDIEKINSRMGKTRYDYLAERCIHKIDVLDGSFQCSDEFFYIYGEILRISDPQIQVRLMTVVVDSMPSVIYMQRKAKELERLYPNRFVKTAILYSGAPFTVELFGTFIAMLRVEEKTRFFGLKQEAEAVEWLSQLDV